MPTICGIFSTTILLLKNKNFVKLGHIHLFYKTLHFSEELKTLLKKVWHDFVTSKYVPNIYNNIAVATSSQVVRINEFTVGHASNPLLVPDL
jgi:hypothetical protein